MRITTWAEYGVICALHLAKRSDEGPVTGRDLSAREILAAAELQTFDLHCETHPVDEERCSSARECSIRPVWVMLQQRIDQVLEGVRLSDLLEAEPKVRRRVGLPVLQS